MCQTGTQFDSDDNFKEHRATQTSPMSPNLSMEKCPNLNDNIDVEINTCPLCGIVYEKSIPFAEFHEHVLSHFTKEMSTEELVH